MLIRLFLAGLLLHAAPAAADPVLWRLLQQGGQVVVMRHATTEPGVGDPPGFRLEDCGSQRNLSEQGRDEARRVGDAFKRQRVAPGQVLSSAWCRCLETARLAFGQAEAWDGANSIFGDPAERDRRTGQLRQRVASHRGPANLVIVTHQVNIQALVGIGTLMAEMVVLTPDQKGGFALAGKMRLD